jgi:peptide/nickel transport system substrate-binding protein
MVSGNKDKSASKVWDNPEGMKLIAESASITDEAKRQAIFDKLEAMIRADLPIIPLYSGTRIGAVRSNVEGYKTWPVGNARMWGVSFTQDN